MRPAPLYGDTMRLAALILRLTETPTFRQSPLGRRLQDGALRLVDHVVLALAGQDRQHRIAAADAELQTLRAHCFLALQMALMEEDSFLILAEAAQKVGRQLGGWIKKGRAKSA
ncbi:MAG: four helix bundle protein [Magnetococcales bacterium]|nr:four helix bundle protein [Magnetococcales bacterium]